VSEKEKITEIMSNRLPHDLQNEILVSLPVKSLLRFQCVSKTWKSLITSPTFISLHVQHSETTDKYVHLLHSQTYKEFRTHSQLHHMDGSFSEIQKLETPCQIGGRPYNVLDCKGLILFRTICQKRHDVESLILWNPAIRMSMSLPQPCIVAPSGKKRSIYGFGFDHRSNDYKVMRLVRGGYTFFPPQAELYKLRTGAWETIKVANDFQYAIVAGTQALVNGASHWVGNHKSDMASSSPQQMVVVFFHMCDEEFRVMKLPDHLSSLYVGNVFLGVSDGLLSLREYNGKQNVHLSCSIWLMKEYGVIESWTKQFTIDLKGCYFHVFSFRNNEKILGINRNKPVLYDPKTHGFINLGIKAKGSFYTKNTFVESLVLLNEVNPIQTCQTCLKKAWWCDSNKGKEKKRKTCTTSREKAKKLGRKRLET
jgi:F-box interacting protein